MKKISKLLFCLSILGMSLSSCGGSTHTHTFSSEWTYDETNHWHAATCEHKDEVSDKGPHTFSNWIVDIDPTEDDFGSEHRDCTVCNYRETRSIDKLEHVHVAGTPVKENEIAPTCTEKGSYDLVTYCVKDHVEMSREHIIVNELGHDYVAVETHATYEAAGFITYTCSRCHDTYVEENGEDKLEHHYSAEWSIDEENNSHYHACTDEGYEDYRSEEAEHSYNWVTDKEATETENGHKTGTCICGKVVEEVINATGTLSKLSFELIGYGESRIYMVTPSSKNIEGVVVIPATYEGVGLYIPDGAFDNCTKITSVVIPEGITKIPQYAFNNCVLLESVSLPDTLTEIETFAFYKCYKLKSITIPQSVTRIGTDAFALCTSIVSIALPDNISYIGDYVLGGCSSLTSVTIGNNMASLPRCLFYQCTSLKTINIPDSVITIGESVFDSCTSLSSVKIGNNVKTISTRAFFNCKSLISITIPESVTSIGDSAFSGCYCLVEIINKSNLNIKKGSDTYGKIAYYAITVSNEEIDSIIREENDFTIYNDGTFSHLIRYVGDATEVIIPNIDRIHKGAFLNCTHITSVVVSDHVLSIGEGAFTGCTSLETITLPFIGDGLGENNTLAFLGCENIKNVILSDVCKEVPKEAFKNYKSLETITFGSKVSTIGENAFYGCEGLTSLVIPNTINTIGYGAFYECTNLVSITLPSGLRTITNSLFWCCSSLESIIIPENVTTIEHYAFYKCTKLNTVTIGVNVNSIGTNVFDYDVHLVHVINKSELNIQKGKSTFGKVAYYALRVDKENYDIKISTDENGFMTCFSDGEKWLIDYFGNNYSITLPDSITAIHVPSFSVNKKIKSIDFGNGLKSVPKKIFEYNYDLESVTLGQSVTTILNNAFYACYTLDTFNMSQSVESIEQYAFARCTSLTSIDLPKSLKWIGYGIFSNSGVTEINYAGTIDEWNSIEKDENWMENSSIATITCTNGVINIE